MSDVVPPHVAASKQLRKEIDECIQHLRRDSDPDYTGFCDPDCPVRGSKERYIALIKLQEAVMWLGMDLKALNDGVSCYTDSYNPESPVIEPPADGVKL